MSPWAPPLTRQVSERNAWSWRAMRYRHEVANWCELCERRTFTIGPKWMGLIFRAQLEVHHRRGRGIRSQVGYEDNSELMTLCERCHDRITAQHRQLGRQRGQINSRGRTIDQRGYSQTISEVTAAAHPRYIRRAIWRTLCGATPTR